MMRRNIRKAVSIICAVALLLSLCVVSFTGMSSAAPIPAEDSTSINWDTTVETYDFNNATGIAYRRYVSQASYTNGVLWLANDGGGGGVWFAKDADIDSISINHESASAAQKDQAYANMLKLEANTTYRVTYKYKYLAGSNTLNIGLLMAPDGTGKTNSSAPNGSSYVTYIQNSTASQAMPEGQTVLAADTEWSEDTIIFTVGNKDVNLGIRTDASAVGKKCGFYLDDFKVEKGTTTLSEINNEYTFDYKNGGTAFNALEAVNTVVGNSGWTKRFVLYNVEGDQGFAASTIEADGLHFNFKANNGFTQSFGWNNNAFVYDTDAVEGGILSFKKDAAYLVTVKYKVTDVGGNDSVGLAVAASRIREAAETYEIGYATHSATSTDWEYLTVGFNTADIPSLVGKYLYLTGRASAGSPASVVVESVEVKEVRYNTGVAVIEYVNNGVKTYDMVAAGASMDLPVLTGGEFSAFSGWYTDAECTAANKVPMNGYVPAAGTTTLYAKWANTASVVTFNNCGKVTSERLAVDLELPRPARPNGALVFEGWYTDLSFTTKVTTVPDHDITVYAKYTGTYLEFNNKGWIETTGTPSLVEDPAAPTNKVLKFSAMANSRPNFMIPAYDDAASGAFELKTNTTYQYSFKVKLVSADGAAAEIAFYRGDHSAYDPNSTTRTALNGANASCSSAEWITVTGSFTTGSTHYLERVKWSYQNHLFFTIYNPKNAIEVYVDDFCVYEVLTEAPEGAVSINFKTNSDEVNSVYGYTGETVTLPANPGLGGHKFVGWYTDKYLTTPYTATTFGTEDITLYAKWETTGFIVDFSSYEKGSASARAKFVNDNGNDYLDWFVEHATTNTSDTGTKYRVFLNKAGTHYKVNAGIEYTITFKYKLLTGTVTVGAVTSSKLNGWGNYVDNMGGDLALSNVNANEWQEAKITFTAKSKYIGNADYLSLGIAGHGHILVDDIVVECGASMANIYGSTIYTFDSNGGSSVNPIGGDAGDAIGTLPTPTRAGYMFNGWYTDAELTTAFTGTTYGEESITLYASWILGKFTESYESFPSSILALGIGGGYKLYNTTNFANYDKANVQNGDVSIYRDGSTNGTKCFTLCRDVALALTSGKQYTVTFYVKPTNVTDAAGTINLIGMENNTGIAAPASTNVITTVGDLKAGEWQKVSYTFTADSKYIGISTTSGNDMYLDNFTITLKGYTGTSTGDASTSPMLIIMMVMLAAGALIVTGKKVFEK